MPGGTEGFASHGKSIPEGSLFFFLSFLLFVILFPKDLQPSDSQQATCWFWQVLGQKGVKLTESGVHEKNATVSKSEWTLTLPKRTQNETSIYPSNQSPTASNHIPARRSAMVSPRDPKYLHSGQIKMMQAPTPKSPESRALLVRALPNFHP